MNERRAMREVGRRLYAAGLVAGTSGNLSVRLSDGRILVTASGAAKGDLSDDDLVVLAPDGTPARRGGPKPTSEVAMHLAVYRARPEVRAVCHAHPPFATAFATAGLGLTDCVSPELIVALGAVPLAAYGTPGTDELARAVAERIREADALLLENHGAITVGRDLFEAFHRMESVEHVAKIVLLSRILGGPQVLPRAAVEKLYEERARAGLANPAPRCRDAETP